MALLSERTLRRWGTCLLAIAVATAARLEVACDDPPPDLEAGRLLTLPGDAAGAALVVSDANFQPSPDASSPSGDTEDAGTSSSE
jgi:hypothetical protein